MTSMRGGPADEETAASRLPAGARQARLTEIVTRNGFISVAEISQMLGVSTMTIRRDLEALETRGILKRTHGGAVASETDRHEIFDAEEPMFKQRQRRNAVAKSRIAIAAAKLIGPSETIALDVGTSVLALAKELLHRADLRIFTNSLPAAITLTTGRNPIYLLGGQLRGPELAVIGPVATSQVAHYYFDKVFIGVSGIIEAGLYDYTLEDTEVKRAFIEQARQVIVLCDSSKFDRRSLAQICSLDRCHTLITEAPPPSHLGRAIAKSNINLVIAEG